MEVPQRNAARR